MEACKAGKAGRGRGFSQSALLCPASAWHTAPLGFGRKPHVVKASSYLLHGTGMCLLERAPRCTSTHHCRAGQARAGTRAALHEGLARAVTRKGKRAGPTNLKAPSTPSASRVAASGPLMLILVFAGPSHLPHHHANTHVSSCKRLQAVVRSLGRFGCFSPAAHFGRRF